MNTVERDAIRAEAFAEAAQALKDMGPIWGGDAMWLTSGTKVADLTASIVRDLAQEES
ncbi:MAG TPA: hypothetical protein VF062_19560 [Candidatus Limnocylindrales bacterium]